MNDLIYSRIHYNPVVNLSTPPIRGQHFERLHFWAYFDKRGVERLVSIVQTTALT